ncbi:MAG: cyclic nucleotide-binding domain-containing protein [Desulfobacterales bacterium]|jgi:CRP-like cAMP-binding protein|nr:cyclic nucleotide-binding domain-containing protein [Desulfobacterales bacterium]
MLQEIAILKSMALFSTLNATEIEKVAELLHSVNVKKGQVLTEEGALARNFFIILSGRYKIFSRSGHEIILSQTGDFIGWATIIAAPKYLGTCVALSSGEVLKLSKQDFMGLIQSDAGIGNKIMKKGSELAFTGEPFRKKSTL